MTGRRAEPGAARGAGGAGSRPGRPPAHSGSAEQANARPPAPRLALRVAEVAESLGISDESFDRYVRDSLPVVRLGTLRLYPVAALEQWLAERAKRVLPESRPASPEPVASRDAAPRAGSRRAEKGRGKR